MENMVCYECVLKHLAAALSYGKEIMSGHGQGADLDHRIDFLGEITNAEHHLQLIDINLFNQISVYRKQLQSKKIQIDQNDLEFIRKLYTSVELKQDGMKNITGDLYTYIAKDNVDLVYTEVKNKDFFKLSYELVQQNLTNFNKIYVLKTDVDLSEFDVEIVNKSLKDFAKSQELTDDFVIMYENTGILKETDARTIIPTYSIDVKQHKDELFQLMKSLNIRKRPYLYDFIKPQLIIKEQFNTHISKYEGQYWLTAFNLLADKKAQHSDILYTVNVNRPICCSTKSNLRKRHFVRWDENGFQSLKDFLNK